MMVHVDGFQQDGTKMWSIYTSKIQSYQEPKKALFYMELVESWGGHVEIT